MHNHNGQGNKSMMWVMVLCCALILAILFFGGKGLSLGGSIWPVLIGIFIIAHIWMMFKGHGGHGSHGGHGNERVDGEEKKVEKEQNNMPPSHSH